MVERLLGILFLDWKQSMISMDTGLREERLVL